MRQAVGEHFRVSTANGDVVARALELRPDLMICALEQADVAAELRRQCELDAMLLLLVTSASGAPRLEELPGGDAQDFIVAPFQPMELRARLVALLARRHDGMRQGLCAGFEQAPEGILLADDAGRVQDVNETASRLLGRPRQELLGRSLGEILPFWHPARSGEPGRQEGELPSRHGQPTPVEVTSTRLSDGRWQAFLHDLSLRRRVERELRSRNLELARAQRVAMLGSWRLDIPTNQLAWSEETYRLFGLPPWTPLTYELFLSCVHPDDRERVDRHWQAALQGEPYDIEHRVVVNGQEKWVREKAEFEFDETGAVVGGLGVVQDVTARRLAEAARRLEEERLQAIVSIAADAIISLDGAQRIMLFNEGAEQIFGWSRDEIVGQPIDVLLPERFRNKHRELVREFGEHEERSRKRHQRREIPGLRRNGEEFPAEAAISQFQLGGDHYYSVVLRDMTEARQAQQALKDNEERLRMTTLATGFGMFDYVMETGAGHWTPELRELFGLPPGSAVPAIDEIPSLVHPADRARVRDALVQARAPEGSGTLEVEHRILNPDGSVRWAYARGRTLFEAGDGARATRFSGTIVDVTERRALEEEHALLAESGKLLIAAGPEYEATLTGIAWAAVRSFADWCIVDVIEPGGRTLRLEVAHAGDEGAPIARSLRTLMLDRTRPHLMFDVLETNRPVLLAEVRDEDLVATAQSEQHLALLREMKPGSIVGVPLTVRGDRLGALALISSRGSRRYGTRDVRVAQELGVRAALALGSARLYEQSRRATAARDQVLSIVAHDLRNPLSGILLHTELLLRRELEERVHRSVEGVRQGARRMQRLIQDLLDVTQLEAGVLALSMEPLSCERVLEEALETLRAAAEEAAVELAVELTGPLPPVLADHDRLLQVFDNLVGNALKFTAPGGRVTLQATTAAGAVVCRVRDTGVGIPEADLPHVFDRFWQASRIDRRGAGLGLSIVRGIVESHGGHLDVESREGEGTTFSFTLPLATEPRLAKDEPVLAAL